MGHWISGRRPQVHSTRTGVSGGLQKIRRQGGRSRARGRTRYRSPMHSGSSVRATTSGVVQNAPGRHGSVCGESAEEVSGHLPLGFRDFAVAGAVGGIEKQYPEVLFLAEAFTRPNVMYRLARLGFSQSYTYFTWRNTKHELTEYFTELTQTDVREYFRPNLWPNTPDILPEFLQVGGRPASMVRLILAATLGASYGIYGPAFELCE